MAPSPTPSSLYDNSQPPGRTDTPLVNLSAELDQLIGPQSESIMAGQGHQGAQWNRDGSQSEMSSITSSNTTPPVVYTEEPNEMTPRPEKAAHHTSPVPGIANQGLYIHASHGASESSATPRTVLTNLAPTLHGSPSRPATPIVTPLTCPRESPYTHLQALEAAICKERRMLEEMQRNTSFFRRRKKDEALKDVISARDFVSRPV